jgi:histidinol-phosphate aminotransferase
MSMLSHVSDKIKTLVPYAPGKPLEELERELGIQGAIKLASNENPLGPSPKAVAAAAKALGNLHRYPDGGGFYLRRALAERWDISLEEVVLGTGSNEIIELLVRTFMAPGDEAMVSENTFSVYRLIATAAGGNVVTVPMQADRYDLMGMLSRISPRTRLVFVCNPNNPTGGMITTEEVRRFMAQVPEDVLVVFDEAYAEYVTSKDYPETLPYLLEGRNVAILRTFSKIYGLAGLRIGYGLMKSELTDMVNRVRQPFNTNALAQIAARAALDDTEHVAKSRKINAEGKAYLTREFDGLGIDHLPTEANFIYFRVPGGGDGRWLFDSLLREGVIIRHIGGPNLRVTIGTEGENQRFIATFKKATQGRRP